MIVPPYLKKGDTVGIVCPSGFLPAKKVTDCIHVLKSWGYQVRLGKTVGNQYHYFSGTDAERLADLQQMLDDPEINAVLFGRGGYGLSRIIDSISFRSFSRHPKWLIGFSDITVLHAHLYQRVGVASLHAPMAAAFAKPDLSSVITLKKALTGKKQSYTCLPHSFNRVGSVSGRIIGGNLSLIAHLVGSRSALQTKGAILFLEDIGEYIYNIDRMLIQLKRNGIFNQLGGLLIGGFTDCKDTEIPFGLTALEVIQHQIKEFDFPVCFNFPVSHNIHNVAIKHGMPYHLSVTNKKVLLKEM
ncbi:MAG: LD-carboxypeptidase [Chitinophagia bacterium]|nr:LD-carboxypeptidase [Chitinophagia bacterium]